MSDLLNHWLHAIVTVPDGRVLTCRTHYGQPAGTTPWAATVGMSSSGRRDHKQILANSLFNRFRISNVKPELLATHSPAKSAYDYRSHYPINVFHIHLEDTITLNMHAKTEIVALPFASIMKDLQSGKWSYETTEVLNIIDALPLERFKSWNIT